MPGVSGVTVVTNACAFYHLHTRLRVHRAPGIPCALFLRDSADEMQNSGAFVPRECEVCLLFEIWNWDASSFSPCGRRWRAEVRPDEG